MSSARAGGGAAARDHLRRRRPRDHRRRRRPTAEHHRDRRGEGARRRGARRVPDPRAARTSRSRRSIVVLTGITDCDGARRTAARGGAAGVPRVLARRGARRPQRALRRGLPQGPRAPAAAAPGPSPPVRRHRSAGPRACSLRDEVRQLQARHPGRALPVRHPAQPPGARRRPRHRRRPARAHRAGRQPRRRTFGELRASPARRRSNAQRRKRHLARLPQRPGVYSSADPAASPLRRHGRRPAPRVRHYFTGADPRGRMAEMVALASASTRRVRHALEAEVRELRLIGSPAPRYNRRSRFPDRRCG